MKAWGRLTDHDAAEIRRRYSGGGLSQDALAKEFGVSQSMICAIVRGYRHRGGPGRIYHRRPPPTEKICSICHQIKPITEFWIRRYKQGPRIGQQWPDSHCKPCRRGEDKTRRDENPELFRERQRQTALKFRKQTLDHYGGRCACCGESQYEFLSLDHIDGGGRQHRLSLKISNIDRWAKTHGYPPVLRVLCHNCNLARGFYGKCPHETERELTQCGS